MRKLAIVLVAASLAFTAQANVVGYENFDGGAINLSATENVGDYDAVLHAGDVFGRVGPSYLGDVGMPYDVADDTVMSMSGGTAPYETDVIGIAGQYTTAFFALNDMDGGGLPGYTYAQWSFDITSAISIDDITIDIAALGDFEASSTDGFKIEAQIDGGGFQEIFLGRTNEDLFKTYRPMDNGNIFEDDDPLELFIDGSTTAVGTLDKCDPATGDFDAYVSTLFAGATGAQLDVRVSWEGTPSGSEPMGIDNIVVNGTVPEPASLLLVAFGLLLRRR